MERADDKQTSSYFAIWSVPVWAEGIYRFAFGTQVLAAFVVLFLELKTGLPDGRWYDISQARLLWFVVLWTKLATLILGAAAANLVLIWFADFIGGIPSLLKEIGIRTFHTILTTWRSAVTTSKNWTKAYAHKLRARREAKEARTPKMPPSEPPAPDDTEYRPPLKVNGDETSVPQRHYPDKPRTSDSA